MNYNEAEAQMATLLKAEMDYHKEHIEPLTHNQNNPDNPVTIPKEVQSGYTELTQKVKRFGERLAADPIFFDILAPWVVDVKGRSDAGEEAIKEVLDDLDFNKFLEKHGSLPSSIRKFIDENGFKLEGSGGSASSWHIGVICNEPDSRRFCALIQQKYRIAIERKAIWLERHFWGWRLPSLYNWSDVSEYCRKNII